MTVKVNPEKAERPLLSETALLRDSITALLAEEGLDSFCVVGRLACDIQARAALERKDERALDLWRARSRLLSNMTTIARRLEGRES